MPTAVTIEGTVLVGEITQPASLTWTLIQPMREVDENVLVQIGPRSTPIAADGSFSIALYATNDPDIFPATGNYYRVELMMGAHRDVSFTQFVTVDYLDGATQEFASLTRVLDNPTGDVGISLAEFYALTTQQVVDISGTHTVLPTDENKLLRATAATTVTLPAGLPVGARYDFLQWTSGAIIFVTDTGVSKPQPEDMSAGQYYGVTAQVVDEDTWWLSGGIV